MKSLGLSVASGLLLSLSWIPYSLTPLIFFAFIPLLIICNRNYSGWFTFLFLYLAFLLFNLITTGWLYNATPAGGIFAVTLNSLMMSIPWILYCKFRTLLKPWMADALLITSWISFEFLHYHWQLNWPWLTLGNVFSVRTSWIQWYEITGSSGGSLWILLSNVVLFRLFSGKNMSSDRSQILKRTIIVAAILLIPVLLSLAMLTFRHQPLGKEYDVMVVQPNVDSYKEKYAPGTRDKQIRHLIDLSKKYLDSQSALLVWPETAIPFPVRHNELQSNNSVLIIKSFLQSYPKLQLISGIDSYKEYADSNSRSGTAIYNKKAGKYRDVYNSIIQYDQQLNYLLYHKSKLVPGVDNVPYANVLPFLKKYVITMTGAFGTLASASEQKVFDNSKNEIRAAPLVCFESDFGEYVTGFVNNGANVLVNVANDGWWGNTAVYSQHAHYTRLRAIENRRWMIRSANTGISVIVNPNGEVVKTTKPNEATVIKHSIYLLEGRTFFTRFGDLISKLALASLFLLLLTYLYLKISNKKERMATKAQRHEVVP